mmetsp:Transcript_11716/g.17786  ORF Transcript_11716/g.17786 Transcript_11716/m.17786 type:complete len:664 (-) Transcript_11716:315-2306(-)
MKTLPLHYPFNETSITKRGTFTHKHRLRAIFRVTAFLCLIAFICSWNFIAQDNQLQFRRQLQESNGIFQDKADPIWLMAPYIVGVLYMFLALAVVCDEYFVPALEVMSGELHLNLTPDIAGATLMAAGGSAPELFTSFIGTFQESEVGFGTIVGSAVFNVLFVIGMCSLLSKETLELTWWPLFRDSAYYTVGLLVLAVFVGIKGAGEVDMVEAIILFAMYLGYIVLMGFNETLYFKITGNRLYPDPDEEEKIEMTVPQIFNFKRPTTFRAGLLTLIREPNVWLDKARISLVSKISGNVDDVFDFVDENGDGQISRDELRRCFEKIERNSAIDESTDAVTEAELDMIIKDIDSNGNGQVSKKEFRAWYVKSEAHIKRQIKKVFNRYDFDKSGGIYPLEFKTMLKEVEPNVKNDEIEAAVKTCYKDIEKSELPFEAFCEWYLNSTWYQQHTKIAEDEEAKTICENLSPPKEATCFDIIKYIFLLPIVATLTLSVPDVRRPGMAKGYWCYFSFIMAIAWIGVYSYFMVGWAGTIGNTLGIDSFIMGLTFLAAGTSVPDLLSSVIVARMGEGDMAVSSSIGSNIFDILVGLPLPWLAYTLWPSKPSSVQIGADGVWVSIMILLCMLVLIIVSIHLSGWRLTKALGFTMFFFYFCFLAQAIVRYILGI